MVPSNIIGSIRNAFEQKKPSDAPFYNDSDKWNIACVSMDTLEDTQLALEYYEKSKGGGSDGSKYLRLYGLLQATFLHQDAIIYLYKAFKGQFNKTKYNLSAWKRIRDLRNLTVSHPIDKNGSKRCYISRVTINKQGFQYMIWDKNKKKDEFAVANLKQMIDEYNKEASKILQDVLSSLK
jgi:hypothetical protein